MILEFSMQVEEDMAFYLRERFRCAATKTCWGRSGRCQVLMTFSSTAAQPEFYCQGNVLRGHHTPASKGL